METTKARERRLAFHKQLSDVSGIPSEHLYFQPPSTVKLNYPCIIYKNTGDWDIKADNLRYAAKTRIQAIVVTRDPDSDIPEKILNGFFYSSADPDYTAENLYHHPITIYF